MFSLVFDQQVIGVCALMNEGDGVFELVRMTVLTSKRGKGYSNTLIKTYLSKLGGIGVRKVYSRVNIRMEWAIR